MKKTTLLEYNIKTYLKLVFKIMYSHNKNQMIQMLKSKREN
jgi:hypothetical protein